MRSVKPDVIEKRYEKHVAREERREVLALRREEHRLVSDHELEWRYRGVSDEALAFEAKRVANVRTVAFAAVGLVSILLLIAATVLALAGAAIVGVPLGLVVIAGCVHFCDTLNPYDSAPRRELARRLDAGRVVSVE